MFKKHTLTFLIFLIAILLFSYLLPSSFAIMAQEGSQNTSTGQQAEATSTTIRERVRNTVSNMGTESALKINEQLKQKLEGIKLKKCQAKANVIRTRSVNIVKHTTRQIEVFDKIASRTAAFYTNKIASRGKTLENYTELMSDIGAKRSEIVPLLQSAKAIAENFSCEGEGPTGELNAFKEQIKLIIEATKNYKTSVRNLIVAVSSLAEEITPSSTTTTMVE